MVYIKKEVVRLRKDPNLLSVEELKDMVIKMCYKQYMILKLYLRKPNIEFEKALTHTESDENVRTLIELLMNEPIVCL